MSSADRASLATELFASLEDDILDTETEMNLATVVRRRLHEIQSGELDPVPWEQVEQRLKALVDARDSSPKRLS